MIHNPGTPPEGALSEFGSPDVVCVCEEPYARFRSLEIQQRLDTYRLEHGQNMFQISAVPVDRLDDAVTRLARRGRYLFATDLVKDFYESFGESWVPFVNAMEKQAVALAAAGAETGPAAGAAAGAGAA